MYFLGYSEVKFVILLDGAEPLAQFDRADRAMAHLARGPKFTELVLAFNDGALERFTVASVDKLIRVQFPNGIIHTTG